MQYDPKWMTESVNSAEKYLPRSRKLFVYRLLQDQKSWLIFSDLEALDMFYTVYGCISEAQQQVQATAAIS